MCFSSSFYASFFLLFLITFFDSFVGLGEGMRRRQGGGSCRCARGRPFFRGCRGGAAEAQASGREARLRDGVPRDVRAALLGEAARPRRAAGRNHGGATF
ncbi:hypothetical protein T492DRAFT_41720 [Pavlovales sp. CCMP2436]|nr:hypothetical protein T492DRAFT_41720 [Pavlovales sp. CCMP2436]